MKSEQELLDEFAVVALPEALVRQRADIRLDAVDVAWNIAENMLIERARRLTIRGQPKRASALPESAIVQLGCGDGTGQRFVYGDYESIAAVNKWLDRAEKAERALSEARQPDPLVRELVEALRDAGAFTLSMNCVNGNSWEHQERVGRALRALFERETGAQKA